jgi:hypothetical protein
MIGLTENICPFFEPKECTNQFLSSYKSSVEMRCPFICFISNHIDSSWILGVYVWLRSRNEDG